MKNACGVGALRGSSFSAAFTLIELILVMVVLTTVLAFVAPSLSHSFQHRHLEAEAARLLALTEFGRDEAVSQGVPMVVWLDPDTGKFGVDAADGYTASDPSRKQYALNPDLHFEVEKTYVTKEGHVVAVQYDPDGAPDPSALDPIRIVDRFNTSLQLVRTEDGWSYEIQKEDGANVARR